MEDKKQILEYSTVKFDLANNTNSTRSINLFDTNTLADVRTIDIVGNNFSIQGTTNYNSFVRDTLVNPKKLDRIMIYASATADLIQPLIPTIIDATGNSCSEVRNPELTISSNQFQGLIAQIDFENFILNVNTYITYSILRQRTVSIVLYYKQYDRKNLLSGNVTLNSLDVKMVKDADTYTEGYLKKTRLTPNWEKNMQVKNFIKN